MVLCLRIHSFSPMAEDDMQGTIMMMQVYAAAAFVKRAATCRHILKPYDASRQACQVHFKTPLPSTISHVPWLYKIPAAAVVLARSQNSLMNIHL